MKLKGAVIRSVLQQNITLVVTFVSGIVIARLMTPAEVGAYAVALALLLLVTSLRDFGIGSYLISAREQDPARFGALLADGHGLVLALTGALTVLLVALSWPAAAIFGDAQVGEVLRIAAAGPLALAAVFPITVRLTRELRFDLLLRIGVAGAAAQAVLSIVLALRGLGALALGWGQLGGSLAIAAATLACRQPGLSLRPAARGWGRFRDFSGWMSATLVVGAVSTSTPQLLVGRLMSLGDAALFARANTIVSLILNTFYYAVMRPMLPGFSETERRGGDIAPLYVTVIGSITGVAWPAYLALCVWAEPLITTLYGPNWSAAAAMIPPIALAHALQLAVAPHHDVLVVKRRPGLLLACETGIFLSTLALLLGGLLLFPGQALWALPLGSLVFAGVYFTVLGRVVGFAGAELGKAWLRSLAVTLAVLPALLLFRGLQGRGDLPFAAALPLSALAGGLCWLAMVRLCGHPLSVHLVSLPGEIARHCRGLFRRFALLGDRP